MSGRLIGKVYREFGGTRSEQNVLLAYAETADDDGTNCRPSIPLIAYMTGYEVRNVKRITKKLRKIKVLQVIREASGRRPTEYEIHLEEAPKKQTFEEWKEAREESENPPVGVQKEADPVAVGVQNGARRGVKNDTLENSRGAKNSTLGVQKNTPGVQNGARRGGPQCTQPLHPSNDPSYDPESAHAGACEGELHYLNQDTRNCVQKLLSIKTWDKDEAATITLASDAIKSYPSIDVVGIATTLAFKMRTGACKNYTKPSRTFANWVAADAGRAEERTRNGSWQRPRRDSIAVVGATDACYEMGPDDF